MRRPFQIKGRDGWQAEYRYSDGKTQRRTFATQAQASAWLDEQVSFEDAAAGPLLGGPTRVTLGAFLGEYAYRFTIAKRSFKTEIERINHYVEAIGAPRLVVRVNGDGSRELQQVQDSLVLPAPFRSHRDARLQARQLTYDCLARLARKRVCEVSTADIRELMTTGTAEGWSDSTIQKEVALLKAAFNSAIREWRWKGFENPCMGIKLGRSNRRFVVVTELHMQRLVSALSECDNPQFWPLVDLAIHTTLRQGSLLSMRWSQTNLETRRARVWAKGRWADAQLPARAVDILRSMPRDAEEDRVFTMSENAVNMAWEGVREKAALPGLTLRDLRHVGATAWAKAGLGVHALKELLGHTTTRMAEVYVNLARSDVIAALDQVAAEMNPLTPLPPTSHAHGGQRHARARRPKVATNVFTLEEARGRLIARKAISAETIVDVGPIRPTGSGDA
ncbi:MAG: tyrosine-type recombinase/integrase [Rubrivivax sp.]|nr:tyrosine-type recombinase/integrase [Rubrivivax sp.]